MSDLLFWQVKVLTSNVFVPSLSLLNFEDKRRFDQRVSPDIVVFVLEVYMKNIIGIVLKSMPLGAP